MTSNMSVYTSADNSAYSKFPLCKIQRGFGPTYDCVLETFQKLNGTLPKKILEIGIGNAGSHIDWACVLPEAQIYGLDNASFSILPSGGENHHLNDTVVGQWANNIAGITKFHYLPVSLQKRITLHWQRDGYQPHVAQEFTDVHGLMDIISNDGKQDGLAHNKLLDNWQHRVNPKGVIVQDKIGRAGGTSGVLYKQINKAIKKGWAVYDCRELSTVNIDKIENGFIAVFGPPEYAQALDKVSKRVYDITDVLSGSELVDDNS